MELCRSHGKTSEGQACKNVTGGGGGYEKIVP